MKPLLGITMGDPAGIGPEIVARALADANVHAVCRPLVVGDAGVMKQGVAFAGESLSVHPVNRVEEADFQPGGMDVLDLHNVDIGKLEHGKVQASAGHAAFEAIRTVIELATAGAIDGTVTAPINKESLNLAGHHYPGHTEIYAELTGTRDFAMLLADGNLRVVHVSSHCSLREAIERVRKDRILRVIQLATEACLALGIPSPRIAVAGLNPHSSEGGLFGQEEEQEIVPAIEAARAEGICVEGPIPPDTVFAKIAGGIYDMGVAMYHDQGHIAVKTKGFVWNDELGHWTSVTGVNITLGLPIVRVSVDHGTAFDQAGKGTARPDSLLHAIEYAARFASPNVA